MAGGMANESHKASMRVLKTSAAAAIAAAIAVLAAVDTVAETDTSRLRPMPKACEVPGAGVVNPSPLPNTIAALKERKKIKIMVIGATSASLRGPVSGGHFAVVERFLEEAFKGLDVAIVHRGVSGELASDAGERIKTEVALEEPDLVFWQLGTADALAQIPIDAFEASIRDTITWLRDHNVDVILVGVRYARKMASDPHYQAIRAATQKVAKELNVLRIARYEAEEVLDRVRQEQGTPLSEVEVTEAGYECLAEYLARAIAAGLFVKDSAPKGNSAPR
jgi:acyl-CoA thioesterase-1